MISLSGVSVSKGIEFGPAYQYRHVSLDFKTYHPTDTTLEVRRFDVSLISVRDNLNEIYKRMAEEVGVDEAAIFQAHLMMLDDPEFTSQVKAEIKGGLNAEAAVHNISEEFCHQLEAVDDEYIRARAVDIRDVRDNILRSLLSIKEDQSLSLTVPSIIISQDLTPSDCVTFDKHLIKGFCTIDGGTTSHSSILARSLGIPAVIGVSCEVLSIPTGETVILDAYQGKILADVSELNIQNYQMIQEKKMQLTTRAIEEAISPAITLDDHIVEVFSNIGRADEDYAKNALLRGAEGVGLLRTEFMFLESKNMPSEEEQYKSYRTILDVFDQRPVILRTLDVGGDKQLPYLELPHELNPFLGVRGLRLSLRNIEMFKTQLRAALRAGYKRNLRLMFPMVTKVSEIRQAKEIIDICKRELLAEGKQLPEKIQVGIMVEIPSAAILARHFADEVDFFSIGTNDLTQYTLAADRTNGALSSFAISYDPSVLYLIDLVIQGSHKKGIKVGLCGELAGDPIGIPILLGLGLDEFSMTPPAIPLAKFIIRKLNYHEVYKLAQDVLELENTNEVSSLVLSRIPFLSDLV